MNMPRLIMGRNGRWLMTRAEKDPQSGKWATRTITTHTSVRAEAEAFRRRYMSSTFALGASLNLDGEDKGEKLLSDLIEGYLKDAKQRGVGATQRDSLRHIAQGELGALYARQLTSEVMLEWRAKRGVSNGTLRRDLSAVKAVLVWADRQKLIALRDIPHIALPAAAPPRDVWLNEAEEQRLWDIASSDIDRKGHLSRAGKFICLALSTGARREAIEDLTWDRVDIVRRTIDFRKPGRRETKKVRVVAVINKRLLPVIERMEREQGVDPRVIDSEGWPRKQVEKLLRGAGFANDVTPHTFRHTFITLLLRAGTPIWDVSRLAGVSPTILTKHYAHHIQDKYLIAQADKRFSA